MATTEDVNKLLRFFAEQDAKRYSTVFFVCCYNILFSFSKYRVHLATSDIIGTKNDLLIEVVCQRTKEQLQCI